MLRANLRVQKCLVNGTVGTVLHIIFKNEGPPALPAVVISQFPSYTGPSFLPGTAGAFPVTPITLTWQSGHSTFSRTGILLSLSWALTIHKCQGLTLDKAVVDIGQPWVKCGLFAAAALRPIFCGLIAAFCLKKFVKRLIAHTVTSSTADESPELLSTAGKNLHRA